MKSIKERLEWAKYKKIKNEGRPKWGPFYEGYYTALNELEGKEEVKPTVIRCPKCNGWGGMPAGYEILTTKCDKCKGEGFLILNHTPPLQEDEIKKLLYNATVNCSCHETGTQCKNCIEITDFLTHLNPKHNG